MGYCCIQISDRLSLVSPARVGGLLRLVAKELTGFLPDTAGAANRKRWKKEKHDGQFHLKISPLVARAWHHDALNLFFDRIEPTLADTICLI